MSEDLLKELNTEELRKGFLRYTRKAFQMLPKMDKPRILDIGCGTGIPTIELARLSNGEIIGIDIDQDALDKLNLKIEKKRLSSRVKIINCSLYKTEFPSFSFNILWDEVMILNAGNYYWLLIRFFLSNNSVFGEKIIFLLIIKKELTFYMNY